MSSYQYVDATIQSFADAWNQAKGNPGLQSTIHGNAESYRKGIDNSYRGSVDGSGFVPSTVMTASGTPTGAPIEKRSEYTSSGSASEDNAAKSVTTQPSQGVTETVAQIGTNTELIKTTTDPTNVQLIENAPSGLDPGKTANGVTLVAGNLLDTVSNIAGWGMSTATTYAKPLVYIGLLVALSKVFQWKRVK